MPRIAQADATFTGYRPAIDVASPVSRTSPFELRVLRAVAVSQTVRKPPALVAVEYGIVVLCVAVAAYLSLSH